MAVHPFSLGLSLLKNLFVNHPQPGVKAVQLFFYFPVNIGGESKTGEASCFALQFTVQGVLDQGVRVVTLSNIFLNPESATTPPSFRINSAVFFRDLQ
jgi:hypothetical protein